jgi:uncharacterized membrane protein
MTPTTERRGLARWVHRTLLAGVILSGVLLTAGLALSLARGQVAAEGTPPPVGELLHRAASGNGPALAELGLFVLMLTPVLRVAVLAVGWLIGGEYRFALVALAVLALLGLGLALGLG